MDLVSVIIPYYKKKKFIHQTLESISKQIYHNLEVILIYDDVCRNDLQILNSFKKKFKKLVIKILINKKNIGAGPSRNRGIRFAKGKYVAFLDADDYWDKNKIQKQINFMKKNNYDFSHSYYYTVDQNGTILKKIKTKNFYQFKKLLFSCDIGLSTVIMKKQLFDKNTKFSSMKTKEDFYLWLLLLKKKTKLMCFKESHTFWRRVSNSLSSSIRQKIIDGFNLYYRHLNFSLLKSCYLLIILSIQSLKKK